MQLQQTMAFFRLEGADNVRAQSVSAHKGASAGKQAARKGGAKASGNAPAASSSGIDESQFSKF